MGMPDAIKRCLGKYVTFSGRAGRPEYWWFALFVFAVAIALGFLDRAVFGFDPQTGKGPKPISSLFQLAMFLPLLAAGWRRMHDSGRPGWHLLLPLIISVGLVFTMLSGVLGVVMLEGQTASQQELAQTAAGAGAIVMILGAVIQISVALLLVWWLTRPSDPGANAFGPPPFSAQVS